MTLQAFLKLRSPLLKACSSAPRMLYCSKCDPDKPKDASGDGTGSLKNEFGFIYDTKPSKVFLEENKKYSWCACGKSKKQPFCDGSHKSPTLKNKLRPVRFTVEKSQDYWLCNCKQTLNRPFCDGTHKKDEIQKKKPSNSTMPDI